MRRDLRSCKAKIAEQQKQIVEYATRLDENDKKNEETSRKFSTLLQVFTKVYCLTPVVFTTLCHAKGVEKYPEIYFKFFDDSESIAVKFNLGLNIYMIIHVIINILCN